ncbi:hypothetical protein GCM10007320_15860 [Pseudorhodoferax aquiterrae]|uniref:Uncharacterized protein n=1 Tax=Pseudorhodoferax aquiterrae TaxID=747304 RepID=A0ABQ3FZ75_9BURK|nr:hypothetical protein [Pseudorhodoferax aquiterrae]GHC76814.1 hypothetical protein GCM10007320_15860 [Pseudorhodoferax aquiterrae]
MEPTLYFHPLASDWWKALIALYASGIAFTPRVVDQAKPWLGLFPYREAVPARSL